MAASPPREPPELPDDQLPGEPPDATHGTGCYVLNILTHGRRYSEEYDQLADAISAALALEHEPREQAESIYKDGVVYLDRAQLDELARAGSE